MKIKFSKYQGTGNDFVIVDNRNNEFNFTKKQIAFLCSRRFGVGADGLMLLENESGFDFKMVYFNSDGNESTMCGNGGRCLVKFASDLSIINDAAVFMAVDGKHEAKINGEWVELKMVDVSGLKKMGDDYWLNTGSPHYVRYVENLEDYPVFEEGKKIRYSGSFMMNNGTNVNFVEKSSDSHLKVRTYERGVEDETLSCGTGATAAALVELFLQQQHVGSINIDVKGGVLSVSAAKNDNQGFESVWLKGPAKFVFSGEIELSDVSI